MKFLWSVLIIIFFNVPQVLAGEVGKRMNPWQVNMDEKDQEIDKGKAVFKITIHTNNTTLYSKKDGEEEWNVLLRTDSAGQQFHATLGKGKYWFRLEKDLYHDVVRQVHLMDKHFYDVDVRMHKIRRPPMQTKKPAIYLYSDATVQVKLDFVANGQVNFVYPKRQEEGWDITVQNNGPLEVEGKQYDYLFWEGERNMPEFDQAKGFVFEGGETTEFLENKLTAMGFNDREKQDFICYWAPQLINNPYNYVHFLVGEDYTKHIASIECDRDIQNELRVFMMFEALDAPILVEEQNFDSFQREGLTLVEWGGGEIKLFTYDVN